LVYRENIMATRIQFVTIPRELKAVLGEPDPGTRVYRRDGPEEECGPWFDAFSEVVGATVSPGGVGMYCPVSRAAVHKRMKDGNLTAFLFHPTHRKTGWFGKVKTLRDTAYTYIPVSEIKQWRQELEERALKNGAVTAEELEGLKPDWEGEFLKWKNRQERLNLMDELQMEGMSKGQIATFLAEMVLGLDSGKKHSKRK